MEKSEDYFLACITQEHLSVGNGSVHQYELYSRKGNLRIVAAILCGNAFMRLSCHFLLDAVSCFIRQSSVSHLEHLSCNDQEIIFFCLYM